VVLETTYAHWTHLRDFTVQCFPKAQAAWYYSGDKYGWSFRISDKKRVLLYLLPRDTFFKVAMVFGQKASNEILDSNVSETIKNELKLAKVYAEGRGIRLDIKNKSLVKDITCLIQIKVAN
jgi:hypothetical protein